ncbi:MAG: hypothetical protein PHG03_00350 [Bacilli bacterium]|nr:hypothetical protein [Bacilli bacterium]MDD4794997.1 hypothetical protein [Bacilli bacterium]
MKKITHSFMERVQSPHLELINFSLLDSNKFLYTTMITEKFWLDSSFRLDVKRKIKNDVIFRKKFIEYFPELYQEISNNLETKQNHLSK